MRKMQADSFAGLVRMAAKLSPDHQQQLQVQFTVSSWGNISIGVSGELIRAR
jgi:hypothetical protein